MRFQLLGPLRVEVGEGTIEFGSARERALLARLLVDAGRVVSTDQLMDQLWDGTPPASANVSLRVLVSRVRKALGPDGSDRILTRAPGYLMELADSDEFDVQRFERLAAQGHAELTAGRTEAAAASLSEALRLWRGPALAGLEHLEFAGPEAQRLEEARLSCLEDRMEADLASGRHAVLPAELERLLADHPLRERFWSQLMLAHYRSGRQADALAAYDKLRTILVDELGIDPSPAVEELREAILRQDPALAPRAAAPSGVVTFLLTDIEGSSELWDRAAAAMASALERHDEIVSAVVARHGGVLVKSKGEGDSTLSVYTRAADAAAAAVSLRDVLAEEPWPKGLSIRVRMAIHTGEAHERGGDYYGPAVNRAARLRGLAGGDQILVSRTAAELLRDHGGLNASLVEVGVRRLRGLSREELVFELARTGDAVETSFDIDPMSAAPARPPLVGRDGERAGLLTRLGNAAGGVGRIVLISGEAGIGKTRLTEEVGDEAARRGIPVLIGRSYETESAPYTPIVEILEALLRQADPETFRELLGWNAAEMARIMPRLRQIYTDLPPALDLPPGQERRALVASWTEFVERVSRRGPVVLVLDDLHWADEATVLLLEYTAPLLARLPVLLLVTYRDSELDAARPFARMLEQLVRTRAADRLPLSRLARDDVGRLLAGLAGQPPPATLVGAVHAQTDGNPFFVEEIFRHLAEEGSLYGPDGAFRDDVIGDLDVPESVRLVVGRRLERLSDAARRMLGAAAVVGRVFDFRLLDALPGTDPDALLNALEEATRARVISPLSDETVDRFGFVHELIRQTIVTGLSGPRRRRLHEHIADAMQRVYAMDLGEHAAEIAYHLVEAGASVDPVTKMRFLRMAAFRATDALSFAQAVRHYEAACALEDVLPPGERPELRHSYASALHRAGWTEQSVEQSRRATRGYAELGELYALTRSVVEFGAMLGYAAQWPYLIELAGEALELVGTADDASRAMLLAHLGAATATTRSDERETSDAMLSEALELARATGIDDTLGFVLTAQTIRLHMTGRCHEAAETGLEAYECMNRAGRETGLIQICSMVEPALTLAGRFEEADAVWDHWSALEQRYPWHPAGAAVLRGHATRRLVVSGDLAEAERLALEDLERQRKLELPWVEESYAHTGWIAFLRGDWDLAVQRLEQDPGMDPTGPFQAVRRAVSFCVRSYRGDRTDTDVMWPRIREMIPAPDAPIVWGAWLAARYAAEGLFAAGDRMSAAELHPFVAAHVESGVLAWLFDISRHTVAGITATAAEAWSEAEDHFEEGMRIGDQLPHLIERAEVRRFYGMLLLDRGRPGDRSKAGTLLADALGGYETLNMPRHAAMVRDLSVGQ